MTLRDFIRNALDREYSLEQAAADTGHLCYLVMSRLVKVVAVATHIR
jgi:hypothetical protein